MYETSLASLMHASSPSCSRSLSLSFLLSKYLNVVKVSLSPSLGCYCCAGAGAGADYPARRRTAPHPPVVVCFFPHGHERTGCSRRRSATTPESTSRTLTRPCATTSRPEAGWCRRTITRTGGWGTHGVRHCFPHFFHRVSSICLSDSASVDCVLAPCTAKVTC